MKLIEDLFDDIENDVVPEKLYLNKIFKLLGNYFKITYVDFSKRICKVKDYNTTPKRDDNRVIKNGFELLRDHGIQIFDIDFVRTTFGWLNFKDYPKGLYDVVLNLNKSIQIGMHDDFKNITINNPGKVLEFYPNINDNTTFDNVTLNADKIIFDYYQKDIYKINPSCNISCDVLYINAARRNYDVWTPVQEDIHYIYDHDKIPDRYSSIFKNIKCNAISCRLNSNQYIIFAKKDSFINLKLDTDKKSKKYLKNLKLYACICYARVGWEPPIKF